MKLSSHKAIGASTGIALGYDLVGVLLVTFGSVLPDLIDRFVAGDDELLFGVIHRTWSHWPVPWVLLFLVGSFSLSGVYPVDLGMFYLGFGGVLHVMADALTMSGVPLLHPTRRLLRIPLMRTGSITEYVAVVLFTTTLLAIRFGLG